MKRGAFPAISASGEVELNCYELVLRTEEDLSAITILNYLSDLRQFALWYEVCFQKGARKASREDRLGVIHEEIERGIRSWQLYLINQLFAQS